MGKTIADIPAFDTATDNGKVLTLSGSQAAWGAAPFDDTLVQPALGSSTVQGALDALKKERLFDTWVNTPLQIFPTGTVVGAIYANGLFVAWGTAGTLATSPDGFTWTARISNFNGTAIVNVIYANSLFVACGAAGKVSTSTDGFTWIARSSGRTGTCRVAGGGGNFVIADYTAQPSVVAQSSDGITWTSRTHNAGGVQIYGLTYGNGVFLAHTGTNTVQSVDGITWFVRSHGITQFNGTAYGAGITVAAGTSGALYSSADNVTWIPRDPKFDATTITGVTFVNGLFFAYGAGGLLSTSADGITWTARNSQFGAATITSIDYGASAFVAVGTAGTLASSSDGFTWTLRTSGFGANAINKVRFLNSALFVAVGAAGNISTSPDGTTWTARTSGVASALNDASFGAGLYVVVGAQTSSIGVVLTSAAGVTWASQTSNFGNFSITGVMFNNTNSIFVAYGTNTTNVITSPNGTAWTAVAHSMAAVVSSVTFAAGLFVAVGAAGKISTSPTGVTFASRTSNTASSLVYITYTGTTFVAVGTVAMVTSPDGITWTALSSLFGVVTIGFSATTPPLFYAVGSQLILCDRVNATGRILVSPNGIGFITPASQLGSNKVNEVAFGAGVYVAVADAGMLSSSADGYTWTARTSSFAATNIKAVTFANGVFVATGDAGKIATSSDGITWTQQTSAYDSTASVTVAVGTTSAVIAFANITSVGLGSFSANNTSWAAVQGIQFGAIGFVAAAYGASVYVVGGDHGSLASSPDGIVWTPRDVSFGGVDGVNGLLFANNIFVAAGSSGKLSSSTNGLTWTARTSQFSTDSIVGVIYANSIFVAYGANGKISTSPDGITWTAQTSQFTADAVSKVIYANSLFIAVGASGKLSTSSDGLTWTARTSTFTTNAINNVAFGAGVYVAVGANGLLATSPDGITWTARTSQLGNNITSIAFNGTAFAIMTSANTPAAAASADGINWSIGTSLFAFTSGVGDLILLGSAFVASRAGIIVTSTDGALWVKRALTLVTATALPTNLFYLNQQIIALSSTSTQVLRTLSAA